MVERVPIRWRAVGAATVAASHGFNTLGRLRRYRGRHHHPTKRRGRRIAAVAAAVVAVSAGAWFAAAPDPAGQVTAAVNAALPAPTATPAQTSVYLAELAAAGVTLTPDEQTVAANIGEKHIAHGHLIGMREPIRADFRAGIPRLTVDQVEIAKTAVEHHFLAVTGRKQ